MNPLTNIKQPPKFNELARQVLKLPVNCTREEAELVSTLALALQQTYLLGASVALTGFNASLQCQN